MYSAPCHNAVFVLGTFSSILAACVKCHIMLLHISMHLCTFVCCIGIVLNVGVNQCTIYLAPVLCKPCTCIITQNLHKWVVYGWYIDLNSVPKSMHIDSKQQLSHNFNIGTLCLITKLTNSSERLHRRLTTQLQLHLLCRASNPTTFQQQSS